MVTSIMMAVEAAPPLEMVVEMEQEEEGEGGGLAQVVAEKRQIVKLLIRLFCML